MNKKTIIEKYNRGEDLSFVYFWKTKSPFSNWYPVPFKDEVIDYWCTEQYMMAQKALLFKDLDTYHRIMSSKDQRNIKNLGRQVRGFDQEIWDKNKISIVIRGNFLKFQQNYSLRRILLDTKDKILVEASPYDCIWGVGLAEEDEQIKNPNNWRGENLLGEALMEVREQLKKDKSYEKFI